MNSTGTRTRTAGDELQRLLEAVQADGARDGYAGKRDTTRFTEGVQLEVTTDPSDPDAAFPVTMYNLSLGGVSFGSRRTFFPCDTVFVREFSAEAQNPWLRAEVRHVTPSLQGALVGAAFDISGADAETEFETQWLLSIPARLPRPI